MIESPQTQPALMSKEIIAIVASAGFTFLTTICTLIYNAWAAKQQRLAAESEARRVALVAAEALTKQREWDLQEKERQRKWDIEDREAKAKELKDKLDTDALALKAELKQARELLAVNQTKVMTHLETAKQERKENTELTRESVELTKEALVLNKEAIVSAHEATDVSHKILEEVAATVVATAPNMVTGMRIIESVVPESLKSKLNADCDGE